MFFIYHSSVTLSEAALEAAKGERFFHEFKACSRQGDSIIIAIYDFIAYARFVMLISVSKCFEFLPALASLQPLLGLL